MRGVLLKGLTPLSCDPRISPNTSASKSIRNSARYALQRAASEPPKAVSRNCGLFPYYSYYSYYSIIIARRQ